MIRRALKLAAIRERALTILRKHPYHYGEEIK